jgi:hypothetical protein
MCKILWTLALQGSRFLQSFGEQSLKDVPNPACPKFGSSGRSDVKLVPWGHRAISYQFLVHIGFLLKGCVQQDLEKKEVENQAIKILFSVPYQLSCGGGTGFTSLGACQRV